MPLEVGSPAPDFTLACSTGEDVSLSSLRGSRVVLWFYPKDNTPGCTNEACGFRDLQGEFQAAGAVTYGVSKDSIRSHGNFISKHGLNMPLLSDPEHELQDNYGVWVEKKNYGRTYMGTERSTFLIDEQGLVCKIWRKVRVKGHVDEVLAAVQEL
jgi:peroxiredoxin Q/BCP